MYHTWCMDSARQQCTEGKVHGVGSAPCVALEVADARDSHQVGQPALVDRQLAVAGAVNRGLGGAGVAR